MAHRAAHRSRSQRQTRNLVWIVGAVVVLLAVLIGIFTARDSQAQVSVGDIASPVEVDGEPLPTFGGDPVADPARGTPAPQVRGVDFDGQPVVVGQPGRPQLVSFMASWCPACQQELPEIVAWLDAGRLPADVDFVVVSTLLDDSRPNWPPQPWLDDEGYAGPVIVDDTDSTIAHAFGLSATPFWVAIDAQGQVVFRAAGLLDPEHLDELVTFVQMGL
ncbi:MAG: TlpA disulfide reductase family protein [Nitriliruptoraceae bacterium]